MNNDSANSKSNQGSNLNSSRIENESHLSGPKSTRRNVAQQQHSSLNMPFTQGIIPNGPVQHSIPSYSITGGTISGAPMGQHLRHNTDLGLMMANNSQDMRNSVEVHKRRIGSITSIQQVAPNQQQPGGGYIISGNNQQVLGMIAGNTSSGKVSSHNGAGGANTVSYEIYYNKSYQARETSEE